MICPRDLQLPYFLAVGMSVVWRCLPCVLMWEGHYQWPCAPGPYGHGTGYAAYAGKPVKPPAVADYQWSTTGLQTDPEKVVRGRCFSEEGLEWRTARRKDEECKMCKYRDQCGRLVLADTGTCSHESRHTGAFNHWPTCRSRSSAFSSSESMSESDAGAQSLNFFFLN